MTVRLAAALALCATLIALPASGKTLRWANTGDTNSLDPYSRNETFVLSFASNIYEPMVRRNRELKIEPALAVKWGRAAGRRQARLRAGGCGLHDRCAARGHRGQGLAGMTTSDTKRRVLVVEDEVIVGMLAEDMLTELGYEVAALSTHLDEAVEFARTLPLDFAVLDVNLNGRMSYPVADTLRLRGVPFIFATGYGPKILVPPYAGTPTLQKPFQIGDLRQMLERMAAA